MTFQKLVNGQWETIAATIYRSTWMGRDRFTVNYRVGKVSCVTWVYEESTTERVLEDTAQ